jgi:hypothetical protein
MSQPRFIGSMVLVTCAIIVTFGTFPDTCLAQGEKSAPPAAAKGGAQDVVYKMEMPKQSAKHKLLEALAGDWMITGQTYKGSPYGEGKFTAREHNEFMKGGLFLVSRAQYSELFKNSEQIAFFGVEPKTEDITYALYSNLGITVHASGTLRDKDKPDLIGNAIVLSDKKVNVQTLPEHKMVYTIEVISKNEYRFKLERDGVRTYDGVAKRVNAVEPKK